MSFWCFWDRCSATQSGDLSSEEALDGILGFGKSNTSMISQLASSGKVRKMFAHCLDGLNGGGIFAIGHIVQPKVNTTPLVPNQYVYISLWTSDKKNKKFCVNFIVVFDLCSLYFFFLGNTLCLFLLMYMVGFFYNYNILMSSYINVPCDLGRVVVASVIYLEQAPLVLDLSHLFFGHWFICFSDHAD